MTYNEEAALKLLGAGSERGFKLIYERYVPSVSRIVYKFLQSRELTDDVVQEVFIKVWVERQKFTSANSFEDYLCRTAANHSIDRLKKIAKEEIRKQEYLKLQEIAANNIDHYIRDKEYSSLLREAEDALPPHCRRVYLLAKSEGLSHKAIAEQLGVTTLTVKSHVSHALKFIKARLENHLVTSLVAGLTLFHRVFYLL